VIFLIVATPTHGLLHITYAVLINPLLSDSFGFSEKESSCLLELVIVQVVGAILMYVTSRDLKSWHACTPVKEMHTLVHYKNICTWAWSEGLIQQLALTCAIFGVFLLQPHDVVQGMGNII